MLRLPLVPVTEKTRTTIAATLRTSGSGSEGRRSSRTAPARPVERFAGGVPPGEEGAARAAFRALKAELNAGRVRAAERGSDGRWRANAWVKAGILLGFRAGTGRARGVRWAVHVLRQGHLPASRHRR